MYSTPLFPKQTKGAQGDTGAQGAQGATGAQGFQGPANGYQGVTGARGATGNVNVTPALSGFSRVGISLSNYGSTWNQLTTDAVRNWTAVASSASGQYQTAVVDNGYIYISNNYGVSWSPITDPSYNVSNWSAVAISTSGQYITVVTTSGAAIVKVSNDYGATWTSLTTIQSGNSVAMSGSGQYQTFCNSVNVIRHSSDYGVTWGQYGGSLSYKSIAMSESGQYRTAVTVNYLSFGGSIYISSDYGGTYTQLLDTSGNSWRSVSMSLSGEYQSAVVYGGYIYRSTNYGNTWSQMTTDAFRNWVSITVSATGQYQSAAVENGFIYCSVDYGKTWIQTSSGSKNWSCICISASGQYQTATVKNNYIYGSISGLMGNTGSQGNTGAQGNTGPQGNTGAQGNTGPQGAIGATGAPNNTFTVVETSANSTYYSVFVTGTTGIFSGYANSSLTYNPSTSTLAATTFNGSATNINIFGATANATYYPVFVPGITAGSALYGQTGLSYNPSTSALTVSGTITGQTISSSSDYRVKDEIRTFNLDEYSVNELNPVYFKFKKDNKESIGLIAHELQEYYPFLVEGEKDGTNTQTVNYIGLIGVLIKEIQELKKRVLTLEQKIDSK